MSRCVATLLILLATTLAAHAATPPTALLVPIDDRPSTLLFVKQLAAIGGADLLTPPRSVLGHWLSAGNPAAVATWLEQNVHAGERAFISADMLCYGGLVASRTAATRLEEARARLDLLSRLHLQGLQMNVLAIIPRLDLRTSDRQAPYAQVLRRWASGDTTGSPNGVPADIVDEYLGVRRRNMEVLLTLLDRAADGTIQRLVIGQDDSSRSGLHERDQARLRQAIADRKLQDRVLLLSGADELAMDMVAGWLAERSGCAPRIAVEYSDATAADRIPPLESLPLKQTVADHLKLAGARLVALGEPSDLVLFLALAPGGATRWTEVEGERRAHLLALRIASDMEFGAVAVADLICLNQADPQLAKTLITEAPVWNLQAYAAWNTASNSMGTAVAQAVLHQVARRLAQHWDKAAALESERVHQSFIFARLVDDYFYQAMLRSRFKGEASVLPDDPDPLLNLYGPIGVEIRTRLIEWANQLFAARFRGQRVQLPGNHGQARLDEVRVEAVLPWQRIFEVEVRVDVRLSPARSG